MLFNSSHDSLMQNHIRARSILIIATLVGLTLATPAFGYIGPGAGFAIVSSLGVILWTMFLAMLTLLVWPIRWVIRSIRGRRAFARAKIRRLVILGLDGMEPSLVDRYMAEGKMPNLKRLKEKGCYKLLGTTTPPLSPVAWSSFLTGCNPGKHNIFDFLTRDRRNYMPMMSSVHISSHRRTVKILGKEIPYGAPEMRGLRRG
ncbi:MAG: alkaline phosphatase family protein, partial [Planctomycetota bacterium]